MAQVKALIGNIKGKDGENFTNYSKDEQVIGKWVDGKPLYRRYFNFRSGSSGGNQYIMDVPDYSNIERITNLYGTYYKVGGAIIYSSINMRDQIQTWIENGKIAISTIPNYYNSDVHLFIEYTKKSDTATS